jgi:hypothetical protein
MPYKIVLVEKLTVAELVKKFPILYEHETPLLYSDGPP